MLTLLFGLSAALCVILLVWGFALMSSGDQISPDWVPKTAKRPKYEDGTFLVAALADLVGTPFTGTAENLLRPWRRQIRRRIDAAGRPGGMTFEGYCRRTAGYVVTFGSLAIVMLLAGNLMFAAIMVVPCLQNELTLWAKGRQRQDELERALPDFLDVLAVTVTAGLSFRYALARVTECMPGPLADEFQIALRQMELGTSRREAFDDLRKRNRAESISQFVTAIQQAEELGSPLAAALRDIGADVRKDAAQWARRKAQRTTPQITMVTTMLTLPALMMIILGALFFSSGFGTSGFGIGGLSGH